MANVYDMIDTWNDGATTFTSIKMNVTDTASSASSLLMDLQVGGSTVFSVGKSKSVFIAEDGDLKFGNDAVLKSLAINTFAIGRTSSQFYVSLGAVVAGTLNGYLGIGGYGTTIGAQPTARVRLYDEADHVLAQRNSTNAQTFNLYNTYTDASNYERGFMKWNANVLEIGTEAAGTGSNRAIRLGVGTARKIELPTIGGWQLYNGATREGYYNWDAFTVRSDTYIGFASGTTVGAGQGDTNLIRVGSGIIGVRANNTTTGGAINLLEQTAPAAPAANQVVIYAEDDGAGKTRLMARFATGAAVQIAIEP